MSIQLARTQSFLQELLIEALSSLEDSRINHVSITEVICSRGKHNAKVFIRTEHDDKDAILRTLRKAQGILREYVLSNSGWYKCPKLEFVLDERFEQAQTLEQIFQSLHDKSPSTTSAHTHSSNAQQEAISLNRKTSHKQNI